MKNRRLLSPIPRYLVPLITFIACVSLYALWLQGERSLYVSLLDIWGVPAFRFPFLDTHAILSAIECSRKGIDVYVVNPCDVLGRQHVYSPLWLWAANLPLGTSDTTVVGIALDLLFLFCLCLLPQPKNASDLVITLIATLSPMVMFALERGNNDLVIFIGVTIAIQLLVRQNWASKVPAYGIILILAALKYYPVVLLSLVIRERWRVITVVGLTATVGGAAFIDSNLSDLRRSFALVPIDSPLSSLIAASNLPKGITNLLTGVPTAIVNQASWAKFLNVTILAPLFVIWILRVRRTAQMQIAAECVARLTSAEMMYFAAGAILIDSCFFAGQSAIYRGVSLLFVLPALCRFAKSGSRTLAALTPVMLFLMWSGVLHRTLSIYDLQQNRLALFLSGPFWAGRELLWWWLTATFAGIVIIMARQTPAWISLHARLTKKAAPV